jgi:hypothetical protein
MLDLRIAAGVRRSAPLDTQEEAGRPVGPRNTGRWLAPALSDRYGQTIWRPSTRGPLPLSRRVCDFFCDVIDHNGCVEVLQTAQSGARVQNKWPRRAETGGCDERRGICPAHSYEAVRAWLPTCVSGEGSHRRLPTRAAKKKPPGAPAALRNPNAKWGMFSGCRHCNAECAHMFPLNEAAN